VLLGAFATFAIVLATVGVFGLLSYLRDAKNAGDRHPRGAGSAAGRHGVESVTHGLKLVASGIAIGIAAAIPLARVMRSMLLGLPDRYADVRRCNRGARGGSGSRESHSCTAGNARRPDRGAADRVSSADPCEACEPYAKILRAFEFPALRVMAAGSFEPTYHPSESRRRVVCMPL